MTHHVLGVIPARLASTRLPRKPLHPIAGRPLVEWVWRRAVASGVFDAVVVATDSPEVQAAARGFGATAVLTRAEHPSGTDRVAEVARREEWRGYPVIVNVQGVDLVREGWDVGTVAVPIPSDGEWRDPAAVKVVRGDDGRALFFSRAPVPFPRDGAPDFAHDLYLRHVGVYAYAREALLRWVSLPEGALERIEKLEQLRALAAGLRIGVAVGEPVLGGVDTPADALMAENVLLHTTAPTPQLERATP
jgi:3-deoxy-manno-octulosonate cytidylyltransferase (CMP-KDO synthetase)